MNHIVYPTNHPATHVEPGGTVQKHGKIIRISGLLSTYSVLEVPISIVRQMILIKDIQPTHSRYHEAMNIKVLCTRILLVYLACVWRFEIQLFAFPFSRDLAIARICELLLFLLCLYSVLVLQGHIIHLAAKLGVWPPEFN